MTLFQLLSHTRRERFEPAVVSLVNQGALRDRIEALGIRVYSCDMKAGRPSLRGLWRLIKIIRNYKPELISGWMYHSALAAQLARIFSAPRVPVIWSLHYCFADLTKEKALTATVIRLCRALSRLPAKIIYVSQASKMRHELFGYRCETSSVIHNGVDTQQFLPSTEARASVRAELGLENEAILIGMLGRFHPMKGHENFLKAAAQVAQANSQSHFVLIGRNVDRQNPVLMELIQELGIENRTHLLGERRDNARLAAALDVFSSSSLYGESCPNVIFEAMACGVPCVVTDIGDAAWMVGTSGRVASTLDPKALATAWLELLTIDPKERTRLGTLARSRVLEHFQIQAVMARYEQLFEQVLAEKHLPDSVAPLTDWACSESNG
jgi:glycosyltransferase involved in cell wall biosynthesis